MATENPPIWYERVEQTQAWGPASRTPTRVMLGGGDDALCIGLIWYSKTHKRWYVADHGKISTAGRTGYETRDDAGEAALGRFHNDTAKSLAFALQRHNEFRRARGWPELGTYEIVELRKG